MLGIMRRGDEERERARVERRRVWRKDIAAKYGITGNFTGLSHNDFCLAVLKKLPLAVVRDQLPQVLDDLEHGIQRRDRPTIRCRIFGCVAQGACVLQPYCTDCQGRCARCGRAVAPRARSTIRA